MDFFDLSYRTAKALLTYCSAFKNAQLFLVLSLYQKIFHIATVKVDFFVVLFYILFVAGGNTDDEKDG